MRAHVPFAPSPRGDIFPKVVRSPAGPCTHRCGPDAVNIPSPRRSSRQNPWRSLRPPRLSLCHSRSILQMWPDSGHLWGRDSFTRRESLEIPPRCRVAPALARLFLQLSSVSRCGQTTVVTHPRAPELFPVRGGHQESGLQHPGPVFLSLPWGAVAKSAFPPARGRSSSFSTSLPALGVVIVFGFFCFSLSETCPDSSVWF